MRPTTRIYVGGGAGYGLIAGAALAAFFLAGCNHNPPPTPAPVSGADAAPYVAPIHPPSAITCEAACQAAETACPDRVDPEACQGICGSEDVSFAAQLAAVRSCDDFKALDPGGASSGGPGPHRGR